jgi:hypothetical protein
MPELPPLPVSSQHARELALGLPDAVEQDHHGRPSIRVSKRIFATRALLQELLTDAWEGKR